MLTADSVMSEIKPCLVVQCRRCSGQNLQIRLNPNYPQSDQGDKHRYPIELNIGSIGLENETPHIYLEPIFLLVYQDWWYCLPLVRIYLSLDMRYAFQNSRGNNSFESRSSSIIVALASLAFEKAVSIAL